MSDDDDWEALEDSGAFEAEAQKEIERKRQALEAEAEIARAASEHARRVAEERRQAEFQAALQREHRQANSSRHHPQAPEELRPADIGAQNQAPAIRILKRDTTGPAVAEDENSAVSDKNLNKKSLLERQAEYARARARIMAEDAGGVEAGVTVTTKNESERAAKPAELQSILREPRGPPPGGGFAGRS